MRALSPHNLATGTAWIQSVFYLVTGLWPLIHMSSFLAVTGPESKAGSSLWLVKTVSTLIIVIGIVIGLAARKRRITPEIRALAVMSAAALTAIDVIYVTQGTISRIYLLDAVAEALLIVCWLISWRVAKRKPAA